MIGPLAYVGGKRRLAKRIVALIPPHTTYVEPFAGGAQVFYAKPPSAVEVLNDLDDEIVNFLRCCQLHADELVRYLSFMVSSRRIFELYKRQEAETLTDVQRAARFLYLQKNAFGGRVIGQNFHYSVRQNASFNPDRLREVLTATARRLGRVQIEQRPYEEVLKQFDTLETFFFCDPPYIGRKLYRYNMADEEYGTLAKQLSGISGRFLLTINDVPLSREVFSRFNVREHSFAYTCARTVPTVRELLVANYEFPVHRKAS